MVESENSGTNTDENQATSHLEDRRTDGSARNDGAGDASVESSDCCSESKEEAKNNNPTNNKATTSAPAATAEERRREASRRVKERNAQIRAQRRFKLGSSSSSSKPQKTKNLILQLGSFVVVVGLLFYFGLKSEWEQAQRQQQEKKQQQQEANAANTPIGVAQHLNSAVQSFGSMLMETVETARRKDACALFLATSSIPTVPAPGLFAGQVYQPGDIVLDKSWFLPVNGDGDATTTTTVASHALLVKFHPTLFNIHATGPVVVQPQADDNTEVVVFRATRTIQPGDELFLPWEQHPQALLPHLHSTIPTVDDYALVDEIVNAIQIKARQMEVAHGRRLQNAFRQLDTNYLYALGQSVASKLHPVVGNMIPSTRKQSQALSDQLAQWALLQNKTLSSLQIAGSCLSDVVVVPDEGDDGSSRMKSLRHFEKGDRVHVIPIHFVPLDPPPAAACDDPAREECDDARGHNPQAALLERLLQSRCWIAPQHSRVALCPLTNFVAHTNTSSKKNNNVAIRWWYKRGQTKGVEAFSSVQELQQLAPGVFAVEVVALSAIQVGDELVYDYATVAEALTPAAWR